MRPVAIILPLAGGGDFPLCVCESADKAAEVVRVLLGNSQDPPSWVRLEPLAPVPDTLPFG
jgi:hypothetical protein